MSTVNAQPEMFHAQYLGRFAEPVFGTLGNPANLYTSLLRHLRPFGATVNSLSINVAVLAQANVSCILPFGFVRISIEQLEVFMRDVRSQGQVHDLLTAVFAAMKDTSEILMPVEHEATLITWARLEAEPFSSYIRRFVTVPSDLIRSRPSVEFIETDENGAPVGAIKIEEAATIKEGLYLRSTVKLGAGPANPTELVSKFAERLAARFRVLELELPFKEK